MTLKESNKKIVNKLSASIKDIYKEEIGTETNISIYNGRQRLRGTPEFIMYFQVVGAAMSKKLKPATCKVLLYLFSKTEYSNYVGVNIETIQEDLEFSKNTIINSIKQLEEYNILITTKDDNDKRRNVYFLNPHCSWKGTFVKRKETIKKYDKNQILIDFDKIKEQTIKEINIINTPGENKQLI